MNTTIDPRLAGLGPDGPDEMGRELAEGPAAVAGTLAATDRLRAELRAAVDEADRIVLLGTGASLAMARAAEPLLRRAEAGRAAGPHPILVRQSTTAVLGAPDGESFLPGDLAIAISQSGGSPETVAAARLARTAGARVLAITADADSPLVAAANLVLHTPSGSEAGAATKSALAALAALAAVAGALPTDAATAARLRTDLELAVVDAAAAVPAGLVLSRAVHAWSLGDGTAAGLASAAALLLSEKELLPVIATTPAEFRHGPIEAAGPDDCVLVVETDPPDARRSAYLARLASELADLRVPLVVAGTGAVPSSAIGLPVDRAPGPAALLETLLRLQQTARVAAHARGTYRDGFRVLHAVVTAAGDIL